MQKSNHKFISTVIPFEEIINFIEPIKVNTNIPLSDFNNVAMGSNYTTVYNKIKEVTSSMVSLIPSLKKHFDNSKFVNISSLSSITYNPHEDGYDFRFNPIDFINIVYSYIGVRNRIPFINLDAPHGVEYFKEFVSVTTMDIRRNSNDDFIVNVANEINASIGSLINYYYFDINELIRTCLVPKDLIFYTAFKHLLEYKKTNDEKYLVFPYEYYNEIADYKDTDWPHHVNINGISYWYPQFISEYKSNVDNSKAPSASNYIINDDEVFIGWEILKPGQASEVLKNSYQKHRSTSNVDYDKYERLYEAKMNFYMNSPYARLISGTYGLLGYMGFSYKNEYLLFDKFFNRDTIDPSKRTILTHGEAIFALPSDRFSVLCTNKQGIIEAKETDDRIRKINHTSNLSFLNRLNDIIKADNVSTSTLDVELEKAQKLALIRK